MTTQNMGMTLPEPEETLGPEWAEELNQALEVVDAHDHSEGNGTPVTPAGMLINDALPMNSNDLEEAGSLGLVSLASTGDGPIGTLIRVGTNLYWVNAAGVAVQLTSGNSIASTGTGEISLSAPASYPHSVTSGDAQKVLAVDTTSARTLNLPAATTAMFFMVKDAEGLAATNNISVVPDGTDLIEGLNTTYLIDANYASAGFVSDGVSKWYVV